MTKAPSAQEEACMGFDDPLLANALFGPENRHLQLLADSAGIHLGSCGARLTLRGEGEAVHLAQRVLAELYGVLKGGTPLDEHDFPHAYQLLYSNPGLNIREVFRTANCLVSPRKSISPKSLNQRAYVDSLGNASITFGVGPAGTGKTYLAVAAALSMLFSRRVKRLVLTRPAVEAGEKLGFLPGDLAQKVNPYLRPLFDALHDMLDFERVQEMTDSGIIEIAPLAFMRGRTLNDAFIILDEAQNTTLEQMKMFVTRLGFGSRMAITGDLTQIDLPEVRNESRSGLVHALQVLKNVEDIRIIQFQEKDVIRHPLVGRIVKAYDSFKTYS